MRVALLNPVKIYSCLQVGAPASSRASVGGCAFGSGSGRRPQSCPRGRGRTQLKSAIKETRMLSKDEVKGKGKQIEGAIKVKVGELTNNPDLEAKGEAKRLEGRIQEKA